MSTRESATEPQEGLLVVLSNWMVSPGDEVVLELPR
jgi:hypothetical protein